MTVQGEAFGIDRGQAWHDAGEDRHRELVVDLFAGGGGVSLGLTWALGRAPDIAVNHSAAAVAMHRMNHPESETRHYNQNVWAVSPTEVCGDRRVGLLWASPDCRHHSRSRAGVPKQRNIRDLPWVVCRWAREVAPRVIIVENVREIRSWGPLDAEGMPIKAREGETFEAFQASMRRLGYAIDMDVLCAADYGVPTIRERLFMIMRRDGGRIVWPARTHARPGSPGHAAGLAPWRSAADDVIDHTRRGVSIFATKEEGRRLGVKRPLVPATMRRIRQGLIRYARDAERPFMVVCNHADRSFRGQSVDEPFRTVTAARDAHGVVMPHLTAFHGGRVGSDARSPVPTVTSNSFVKRPGGATPIGYVAAHVRPLGGGVEGEATIEAIHVTRQFGQSVGSAADEPVGAVTAGGMGKTLLTSARLTPVGATTPDGCDVDHAAECAELMRRDDGEPGNVVTADGVTYVMHDVTLRMFEPDELYRAQGFPDDYITKWGLQDVDGVPTRVRLTKTQQVSMCGNAVPPRWAEVLAASNFAFRYYPWDETREVRTDGLPLFAGVGAGT